MLRNQQGSPCSVSISLPWPGPKPCLFLNLLLAMAAFPFLGLRVGRRAQLAVEVVLDLAVLHHDAALVPLADGLLGLVLGGVHEVVDRNPCYGCRRGGRRGGRRRRSSGIRCQATRPCPWRPDVGDPELDARCCPWLRGAIPRSVRSFVYSFFEISAPVPFWAMRRMTPPSSVFQPPAGGAAVEVGEVSEAEGGLFAGEEGAGGEQGEEEGISWGDFVYGKYSGGFEVLYRRSG